MAFDLAFRWLFSDDHTLAISADAFDELGELILNGAQRLIDHEHNLPP